MGTSSAAACKYLDGTTDCYRVVSRAKIRGTRKKVRQLWHSDVFTVMCQSRAIATGCCRALCCQTPLSSTLINPRTADTMPKTRLCRSIESLEIKLYKINLCDPSPGSPRKVPHVSLRLPLSVIKCYQITPQKLLKIFTIMTILGD